jgi:hypothetical protein
MTNTLDTALALHKKGFAVHWLVSGEKRPVESGWSDAPLSTAASLKGSYRPGFNVGFRAGKWSIVDGREVCVLDVDIRGGPAYADEAYAAAKALLGGDFKPHVVTGSGVGRHQYLLFPRGQSPGKAATTLRQSDVCTFDGKVCSKDLDGASRAWVIELLSTGKNVVLPPSIHPDTGKSYTWAKGVEL